MENNPYQTVTPNITDNSLLRIPQQEAYKHLVNYAEDEQADREVGIVLPVGCGKSGCITISPFAFKACRSLVIAPGVKIAQQLHDDFDPALDDMFYLKCAILDGPPFPEPVEIRGTTTNVADLEEADVVITNIQQLQGEQNRWLRDLPEDFFDLILVDEGHHNVAASWETLRHKFPHARIVNFSATPLRADGQLMAGSIIYTYPIFRAILEGYIKKLKAVVLNPRTLKYVRREDEQEIEVSLEEVIQLGEDDSDFRRSIVTSAESLNTIVDASIRELDKLRKETGERRLKIIASALNYQHCIQITAAYRARGRRAAYVHSLEDGATNDRILEQLENNELDVIVQVRKLGEGFDHHYLSVAAVFSIFRNLSPFIQFVGRIMRVIVQKSPSHPLNQGTVVFHAGANIARRWTDFQIYSEADQEFFDQLLPVEELNFEEADDISVTPEYTDRIRPQIEVSSQESVLLEEIPLLQDDGILSAFEFLKSEGFTAEDYQRAAELIPVPTTKVRERRAAQWRLNEEVKNRIGREFHQRGINPRGHELDARGRTNFEVLKSAIDRIINRSVGRSERERHEFSRQQLDQIRENFDTLVDEAIKEVFDG